MNSLGEGSLWVCNKTGSLENGDYISSSSVPGYGMKQTVNEGVLTNYTVAKITCDCNFSITKQIKQKIKLKSTTEIDYDSDGNVQYENDLDSDGNTQLIYEYQTRFLTSDGTELTESDYTTKLANNESVYIACFVGCTYHCG